MTKQKTTQSKSQKTSSSSTKTTAPKVSATKAKSIKASAPKSAAKSNRANSAKTTSAKSSASTNFAQAPLGNLFDSDFVDDMKSGFEKVMNSSSTNMCGNVGCISENHKMIQKMMEDLGKQMQDAYSQQMQLGLKSLSCRNMTDAIDLVQTGFKNNFDNAMKFNSNLFNMLQQCQMNNLKHTKKCMEGNL